MRVFVTGATGLVGSAVVSELIAANHQVLGLARSESAARALKEAGAEVHWGDLEDLESLQQGVAESDGVIHTGFIHDFTRFKEVCAIDRRAIESMGSSLSGTQKPFIVTSGVGLLSSEKIILETDRASAESLNPRVASELAVDKLAAENIPVSVVRLAPSVHGEGDRIGFVPILIKIAREKGVSVYSDQENIWCGINRLDAAKLYRLALDKSPLPGTRYHGVAEESIPFQSIAEKIGRRLNIPVEKKPSAEAREHFGWFEHFAAMNVRASAHQTQNELNWRPEHPGLLEDLDSDWYFR